MALPPDAGNGDVRKMTDALHLPDALTKATNGDFKVTPAMRKNSDEWEAEEARKEQEKWPDPATRGGAGT
ncbi:MAG: hypothetical protein V4505_05015 [Pseudomonadota bacterium]